MHKIRKSIFLKSEKIIGYIGRKSIFATNHILDLIALTIRIFGMMINIPKQGRLLVKISIIEQIYFTGVKSLPIIIPIALMTGTLLTFQFNQLLGQYDIGKMATLLIIREFGPLITAIVVILRSATSVTIEIGYMVVLNEIETIEMCGIDPMRMLGLPRLVGITAAIMCLFIIFDIVSIIGGAIIIWAVMGTPMDIFLEQVAKAINAADITVGIIKAILFGIIITIVSLYHGYKTPKNISFLAISTSKSAVECFFYCLLINIIISIFFYF